MTRDDIIRMAREAGAGFACDTLLLNGKDADDFICRFAALVVADAMARGASEPVKVNIDDIDPALLRDMLAKASTGPLVPAPSRPMPEAIAAAVAAEREAIAQMCQSEWATEDERKYGEVLAAAIRARGAA